MSYNAQSGNYSTQCYMCLFKTKTNAPKNRQMRKKSETKFVLTLYSTNGFGRESFRSDLLQQSSTIMCKHTYEYYSQIAYGRGDQLIDH